MFGFLAGGVFKAIVGQLTAAYKMKMDAKNDGDRIRADILISGLKDQRDVLIAEQKNAITRFIRPAFAAPFIIYNFKVLVWDKVLGWGATDSLPPEFWKLQMIVFGAYFLTRGIEKLRK